MRFISGLVAGYAITTSAFLIPPDVPEDLKDLKFTGGPPKFVKDFFHTLLESETTNVDLLCSTCPFASSAINGVSWEENVENTIHLEFATKGSRLELNGHPLLPLEEAQKAQSTTIKAHQIRLDTDERSANVSVNFAMEIMPPMPSPHKDGISMIPIEFTVLALEGRPVKVNTVSLKLVQTPHKDLVIVKHEQIAFAETPGADTCEGSSLWTLCRLRAIVVERIQILSESAREKADHVQGWIKQHCGGRRPHLAFANGDDSRDQHHHHHHHHHHHQHSHHGPHRYRRVGHMLHQTFRFFLIPALLGVIGGLAASAIGMLVGKLIVFLWFHAYHRGQRGPLRSSPVEVLVASDEKDNLLAEEALPQYADTPPHDATASQPPLSSLDDTVTEKQ